LNGLVACERDETVDGFIKAVEIQDALAVVVVAGIAENVKTLMLPSVTLGSLEKKKISAAVLDLEPVNETSGFRQSGILGSNFLHHFRVIFDFQRGVIRLEPLDQTAKGTETVKPKEM